MNEEQILTDCQKRIGLSFAQKLTDPDDRITGISIGIPPERCLISLPFINIRL